MDLFAKFKEGYFSYLASVIAPALINALSIPFFKRELGAEVFGKFAIFLNAILLITYFLFGWLFLGILRYYSNSPNKKEFCKRAYKIGLYAQLALFIPVVAGAYFFYHEFLLAVLFVAAIQCVSLQLIFLSFTQAALHSKQTMYAEMIRSLVFISLSFIVVFLFTQHYLYGLILAIIASYAVSFLFLHFQFFRFNDLSENEPLSNNSHPPVFKNLLYYGTPLSLWFLFTSMSGFIDKLFIAKHFGHGTQGNYQAMFDLISKSITMLMTPILTSIFPLLTIAYKQDDSTTIRMLKKKIIFYEVSGYLVISVLYWTFGASLLFSLLKIPDQGQFRLMGFLVITSTIVWQIAMLVHKKFELKYHTIMQLKLIILSFLVQLVLYLLFSASRQLVLYPLGNLIFSVIYLVLVSCIKASEKKSLSASGHILN